MNVAAWFGVAAVVFFALGCGAFIYAVNTSVNIVANLPWLGVVLVMAALVIITAIVAVVLWIVG